MKWKLPIAAFFLLLATAGMPHRAAADFWTRHDHPWRYAELRQAIAFCRIQPRVNPSIPLFLDLVDGKQIDRCMRALGWVPVAD